jgi:hypothetical protein
MSPSDVQYRSTVADELRALDTQSLIFGTVIIVIPFAMSPRCSTLA